MTSAALLWGIGAFLAGWLLHLAWWRVRRPADDLRALVLSVLVLPALAGALAAIPVQPTLPELLMGYGVLGALGLAYSAWYPAAQAASPTMLIVLQLGHAGQRGLTATEITAAFDDDQLCRNLIRNLVDERFAVERNGRLYPGPRGHRLLRALGGLRRCIGLKEARG